jgi:Uri superfamily endonuclease
MPISASQTADNIPSIVDAHPIAFAAITGGAASGPGSYVLILKLTQTTHIPIGRLGLQHLKPGYYLYVGSALGPGGLSARLKHHLADNVKRCHWHIDYLRTRAAINRIWYRLDRQRCEHDWATIIAALPGVEPSVKNFGSTDCRCPTHLFCTSDAPDFDRFNDLCREAEWGK